MAITKYFFLIFPSLCRKDNVWIYFFFPSDFERNSYYDATSTGIETWLKVFSSLVQHFRSTQKWGNHETRLYIKHVDIPFYQRVRSWSPRRVSMYSELKLVEFSNFRLFIIFSNLWQKKKNRFTLVLVWFGLVLINLSLLLLSSPLNSKSNSKISFSRYFP